MTAVEHGFQLRAPWYVCRRGGFDRFAPQAGAPALQKYDSPGFVQVLTADPRVSLTFDQVQDVWSYPVAVAPTGSGRLRFATHRLVRTRLRKLYQPSHSRFYAVVVELFCDQPGLPRPGAAEQPVVKLVMRRQTFRTAAPRTAVRKLAKKLTADLLAAHHQGAKPEHLHASDVDNLLWADLAYRARFEADNAELLAQLGAVPAVEAWMVGDEGAQWRAVGTSRADGKPDHEQELPMWRIPNPPGTCEAAATRSLWFGLVPTFSGEHDDQGAPKLDDQAVYEILCVARRPPAPGHEHCPPQESWSAPTEPFRLAAFYDPEGTKNRKVSITMPDLRAVAARAGAPAGPGGVAVTSPPGSQLSFDPNNGSPKNPALPPGGTTPRICTFALELLMIVAFFVFSLFLPVVVFLFQLWWLLLLRFCLPPDAVAMAALQVYFASSSTLSGMGANEQQAMDTLLGAKGATAGLLLGGSGFQDTDGRDLFTAIDPTTALTSPPPPAMESSPPDPLCGAGR